MIGKGKKRKVRLKDFYVLQYYEEVHDNLVDKEEALDNLSDAIEGLFAICPHSGYEDISKWHSSQDVPRLVLYRESAREDLEKARIDNAKEVLGKCYGSCTRAGNADGVAGHLGMFISNIGREDRNSEFTRLVECGGQGIDLARRGTNQIRE